MHSRRRIRLGRARQNHTTLGGDAQRRPTCVEHMRRENETGHRALVRRADESARSVHMKHRNTKSDPCSLYMDACTRRLDDDYANARFQPFLSASGPPGGNVYASDSAACRTICVKANTRAMACHAAMMLQRMRSDPCVRSW